MGNPDLPEIDEGFYRAELRLRSSIYQSPDPRLHDGAYAHHTRFHGDIQRQARETVVRKLSGRLPYRHDLGVSRGIHGAYRLIEADGDDVLLLRDDGAYRNLTQVKSVTRLLEGKTHHVLLDPS